MTGELAEHVRTAYGLGVGPVTLTAAARGAVGRIWQLDLGDASYAVKQLLRASDEAVVRREVAFATQVLDAGVLLPASVADRSGRYVVPVPEELDGGWSRLYQWIDGVPVDLDDPGVANRLGVLLGLLHAHASPPEGAADPWYDSAPEPASWARLIDRAHDTDWGRSLASHIDHLIRLGELVTAAPADQLVTCHRDIHPGNVLVDDHGELVLLDWDDVGPASPDRELAIVLVRWHFRDGRVDSTGVTRTLAAYRSAGGHGRLRDRQSFGMAIAADLNFLQSQAHQALDEGRAPEHRAHAVSEVRETLTTLPPLPVFDELLELAD